jgi:hypothetical protein
MITQALVNVLETTPSNSSAPAARPPSAVTSFFRPGQRHLSQTHLPPRFYPHFNIHNNRKGMAFLKARKQAVLFRPRITSKKYLAPTPNDTVDNIGSSSCSSSSGVTNLAPKVLRIIFYVLVFPNSFCIVNIFLSCRYNQSL